MDADATLRPCGFAAGEVDPADFAERAFIAAEEWVQILRSSPAVSARPQPDVWSPLEYGAHVRDVYRLYDARLAQMLNEDSPTFANWNQDETAIKERYKEQDPEVVADELEDAAQRLAARIRRSNRSSTDDAGSGLMARNSRS